MSSLIDINSSSVELEYDDYQKVKEMVEEFMEEYVRVIHEFKLRIARISKNRQQLWKLVKELTDASS